MLSQSSSSTPRVPFGKNLHYAWVMFGVAFIILLGASGFRSAPGVLMVPLQEAFGWDRGTISFAVSINLLLYGFMGPFAAALMERYAMRLVVSAALILISAGALLTLVMTEPMHLFLTWGVMVGLGSGSMATVMAATIVSRWFVAKRGLAMGALTAASATGQLLFLPIIAKQASIFGWQAVSITIAAMALAVVPIAFIYLRDQPTDLGLTRLGAPEGDVVPRMKENPIRTAWSVLFEASRTVDFWVLSITFFVCGATTNGLIGTHLIPAGHDHGLSAVAAANLLAVIGIFDVIGTIGSGWLTDRVDPRKLLFAYYALRGLSLMALSSVLGSVNFGLIAFIVFYGLDWVATVPPTVQLCQQIFGPGKGSVVYGWVFSAHQVGAALIAWLAGVSRTRTGDYAMAFYTAGAMAVIAAFMIMIIRAPKPGPPVATVPAGD